MAGFVIGAILAMSWNLFQKILNYIIFYGFSIVEVYTNLLQYAQKQFDIRFDIVWLPILVLFVIYGINGVISAVIGIRVGRKLLDQPTLHDDSVYKRKVDIDFNRRTHHFNYSIVWLLVDLIFMVGALVLLKLYLMAGLGTAYPADGGHLGDALQEGPATTFKTTVLGLLCYHHHAHRFCFQSDTVGYASRRVNDWPPDGMFRCGDDYPGLLGSWYRTL